MHTKITKRVLESTASPTTGVLFLRDTDLKGFGVRISSKGSITFFAEGRLRRSRNKRTSLGRYPVVSIENARKRARETLYKLNLGIDPHQEERARIEAERTAHALEHACSMNLAQVMDDYFRSRPIKSETGYRNVLKNVFSDWMERPIRNISRQDVENRYREVALKNGHKAQAAKAMRCLSAVMNFARAELVNGQQLIAENPVEVLRDKKVDRTIKPKDHHIPKEKLGSVIRAVLSECTSTARDALLLELFTGLRDSEAKKLKWTDVDFEREVITIAETKNGKPHVFGMGRFVCAMMQQRDMDREHRTFVFSNKGGTGPLGNVRKQLVRVHKTAGFTFTHHDLRRTFATLLSGELGIPDSTISKLLNHSPSGVTAKHYVKADATKFTGVYDQLYELVNSCLSSDDSTLHIADLIQSLYAPTMEPEETEDGRQERQRQIDSRAGRVHAESVR